MKSVGNDCFGTWGYGEILFLSCTSAKFFSDVKQMAGKDSFPGVLSRPSSICRSHFLYA